MAADILTQPAGEAPPLETVLLWLTSTVERDYISRRVFPSQRYDQAKAYRASATLHYLTPEQAKAMLADALNREPEVSKGLKKAFRGHIKSLQSGLAEAAERPAVFSATAPTCIRQICGYEVWRGTKQQLLSHGIRRNDDLPWPGEPGGKERSCGARDSRGYKVSIKRHSAVWPGIFEAAIAIPYEVQQREHTQAERTERARKARQSLAVMPQSADDFRTSVIAEVRRFVRFQIEWNSKPSEHHGFRLAEGVLALVDEALDGVIDVLSEVPIHFDAVLQSEVARKHRAELASADATFQSKMAAIMKPDQALIDGSRS